MLIGQDVITVIFAINRSFQRLKQEQVSINIHFLNDKKKKPKQQNKATKYTIMFAGLGGGYNERGKVEYKDKVPSDDDEYDDVCDQTLTLPQHFYRIEDVYHVTK